MIRKLVFLKTGQTPDNAPADAPSVEGEWGADVDEAVDTYQEKTGRLILDRWPRGDTLFVLTQYAVDHALATK